MAWAATGWAGRFHISVASVSQFFVGVWRQWFYPREMLGDTIPRPATQPTAINPVQAAQNALAAQRPNTRELPRVRIPGGDFTVTASAETLFQTIAASRRIFYRGGLVVELVTDGDVMVVDPLDAASAVSRFEKYVRFVKESRRCGDMDLTNITETIAKQYLKSEAARTHLPKLNGIVHYPLLVEKDGQLIPVLQGYDEHTGLFVASAKPPTEETVESAVDLLTGMLRDFDFVTPGDRSRAIASLITPAMKLGGLIKGSVPVDVAEANASQSGKSYRHKVIAALYNQHLALVTKKGGGVGSMEETFSDHLVKGRVFIQFDNVRGKLDSQYLEAFLTSDGLFPARVPYQGNINIDPTKFMLFISSNGFEATRDLANRASIIRILKRDNYQFLKYEGRDLLELTKYLQQVLMGCVFAVIREWHRQGKPHTSETRHDFREWCQALDWIVQNIFHAAPLMDGHDAAKQRASNPSLTFLRAVAVKLSQHHALGHAMSAADISQVCLDEDIAIPGVNMADQTVEQGPMQIGRIMKPLFLEGDEVTFDEFRVTKTAEQVINQTSGNLYDSNRYTFHPITTPVPPAAAPTPQVTAPAPTTQPQPPPDPMGLVPSQRAEPLKKP